MTEPEDVISLAEAADISGRAPVSLRRAAAIGRLDARKVGNSWVTTRGAISAYMAYVASAEWQAIPQRMSRPGGHARRRSRRRTSAGP